MDKNFKDIDYKSMKKAIEACGSVTEIIKYFGYNSKNDTIRKEFRRKIKRLNLAVSHYENIIFRRERLKKYNKENLTMLVEESRYLSDILYELDLIPISSNYRTLKRQLDKFNVDYSKFNKIDRGNEKYTKEFIEDCVKRGKYMAEAIRNAGLENKGGNFYTFKKYIKKYDIDISHFNYKKKFNKKRTPIKEILVENSSFNRGHLKKRLFEEKLKEKKCEVCGQEEDWNGKTLSFILDHINGVSNDNRFKNLRIICPNCDSTLDTYCGRNNKREKKKYFCIDCGKEVCKTSKRCKSCQGKQNKKVETPAYEQLIKDIKETNYCAVGRKYKVSDNAVRKWIKKYKEELNIAP